MANSQCKIHKFQLDILSVFAYNQDDVWIHNFYFRTIQPLVQRNIESDFSALNNQGLVDIEKILPQLQNCQQFIQQVPANREVDLELTDTFNSLDSLNLPDNLKIQLKHPYMHNKMLALYQKLLTAEILGYMQSQAKILEKNAKFKIQAQKYKLWTEQQFKNLSGMSQPYWQRILMQPIQKWAHELRSTLSGKVRFQIKILNTLLKKPFDLNNNLFKIAENSLQFLLCSIMTLFYNAYLATHTFYFITTIPFRVILGYSDKQISNTINFFTALTLFVAIHFYLTPYIIIPTLIATGLYLAGSLGILGLFFNPEKNATPPLDSLKPFPPFYETLKMASTFVMPFYNTLDTFYKMSEETQILCDKNLTLVKNEHAIMRRYQAGEVNETLNERKQIFIDKIKLTRQFNIFLQNYWLFSNNASENSLQIAKKLKVESFHDELIQKIESDLSAAQAQPSPQSQTRIQNIHINQQDLIRRIIQLKNDPNSPWREAVSQEYGQEYTDRLLDEINSIENPMIFVFRTPPSELSETISTLSQMPKPKC